MSQQSDSSAPTISALVSDLASDAELRKAQQAARAAAARLQPSRPVIWLPRPGLLMRLLCLLVLVLVVGLGLGGALLAQRLSALAAAVRVRAAHERQPTVIAQPASAALIDDLGFDAAIARDPDAVLDLHLARARALVARDRRSEALATYDRALDLGRGILPLMDQLQRAELLVACGNLPAAEAAARYLDITRLDPTAAARLIVLRTQCSTASAR